MQRKMYMSKNLLQKQWPMHVGLKAANDAGIVLQVGSQRRRERTIMLRKIYKIWSIW